MDFFATYPYSQANPSARYRELLAVYQQMHREGVPDQKIAAEKTFPGTTALLYATPVRDLIINTHSKTMLDYGCGKGQQYKMRDMPMYDGSICPSLQSFWKLDSITCYDPAYPEFMTLPEGKFDGVICTDVLEHCPEEDMPWILDTLFSYATKFVFATAACYPAKKTLPNGDNAHITLRPPQWWQQLLGVVAARHPGIIFEVHVQYELLENHVPVRKTMILSSPPTSRQHSA